MSEKAPRPWLIVSGSYRSRLRAHRESAGGRTRPQRRIPARRLAPAPPARRGSFAAREDGDLEAVDACAARPCQQRSPAHAFMEPCRRYCARARGRDGESPPAGERTASFRVPPLRAPPAADRDTSQPVRWAPEGSSRSCRLLVTVGPPERCNGGVPGRLGTPAPDRLGTPSRDATSLRSLLFCCSIFVFRFWPGPPAVGLLLACPRFGLLLLPSPRPLPPPHACPVPVLISPQSCSPPSTSLPSPSSSASLIPLPVSSVPFSSSGPLSPHRRPASDLTP